MWVRDHTDDTCPAAGCDGRLGPAKQERRQRWETFPRRKDAEKALSRYLSELDRGRDPFPRTRTVGEWLAEWLDASEARVRPRTLYRYRQFVDRWWLPRLGDLRLDKVRPADVSAVLADMRAANLAPRTIQQARSVLSKAYNDATRGELVDRNPVTASDRRRRPIRA